MSWRNRILIMAMIVILTMTIMMSNWVDDDDVDDADGASDRNTDED